MNEQPVSQAPMNILPGHIEPSQSAASRRQLDAVPFRSGSPARELPGKSSHAKILVDSTREFSLIARPDRKDVERYKELFYQLVDRLEKADRRLISAMLARSAYAPRAVALYLGQDALEVAAPFLLFSPVLNDLDLRAIAARKGKIYADVIKKRQLPMEPFTAQKLDEAPLDGTTLEVREKLPPEPLKEVSKSGESKSNTSTGDEIVALAGIGGRLGKKTPEAVATPSGIVNASKPRNNFKLPKKEMRALLCAARQQNRRTFAQLVEGLCGLDGAATEKLLCKASGDEVLYLIKALGVPAPHDIQMALMTAPRIGRSIENYRHAKKLLGDLDAGICRMIFNEIGARFDLGVPNQSKTEALTRSNTAQTGLQEAMQDRRRSVLETYKVGHKRPQSDKRFGGPGGMAPMSRWPGSEAGLQEAV